MRPDLVENLTVKVTAAAIRAESNICATRILLSSWHNECSGVTNVLIWCKTLMSLWRHLSNSWSPGMRRSKEKQFLILFIYLAGEFLNNVQGFLQGEIKRFLAKASKILNIMQHVLKCTMADLRYSLAKQVLIYNINRILTSNNSITSGKP